VIIKYRKLSVASGRSDASCYESQKNHASTSGSLSGVITPAWKNSGGASFFPRPLFVPFSSFCSQFVSSFYFFSFPFLTAFPRQTVSDAFWVFFAILYYENTEFVTLVRCPTEFWRWDDCDRPPPSLASRTRRLCRLLVGPLCCASVRALASGLKRSRWKFNYLDRERKMNAAGVCDVPLSAHRLLRPTQQQQQQQHSTLRPKLHCVLYIYGRKILIPLHITTLACCDDKTDKLFDLVCSTVSSFR